MFTLLNLFSQNDSTTSNLLLPVLHMSSLVCEKAFKSIYNISDTLYRKCIQDVQNNRMQVSLPVVREQPKAKVAFQWLKNFAERIGEIQPDTNDVHLPSFFTKRELYHIFVSDVSKDDTTNNNVMAEVSFCHTFLSATCLHETTTLLQL